MFSRKGYERRLAKLVEGDDILMSESLRRVYQLSSRTNGKLSMEDRVGVVEIKLFQDVPAWQGDTERRVGSRTGYGYGEGTAGGTVSARLQV